MSPVGVAPTPDGTYGDWASFSVLRADPAANRSVLLDAASRAARAAMAEPDGPLQARVHEQREGAAVVVRCSWRDAEHGVDAGELLPGAETVAGRRRDGVSGPAAGERPGIVAIALRWPRDRRCAELMLDALRRTSDWKGAAPGFLGATPYVSDDGERYVNYPSWTDEAAFREYMADGRQPTGVAGLADLEAAEPEFLVCRVVADHARLTAAPEVSA